MKKIIAFVVLLVALSGSFWILAPAYMKDKVVGVATFYTSERQCFNYRKAYFNDPDTAYVDGSFIWTKEREERSGVKNPDPIFEDYDEVVSVKVYAKNRLGNYIMDYVRCPLENGKFSETGTLSLLADEYANK